MSYILLALFATSMWAVANMMDKVILTKHLENYILYVTFAAFFGLLFAGLISLIFQISIIANFPLILSLLNGFMVIIALFFYFKALSIEEVTRIVPALQIIPLVVIVLSWISLKETLGAMQYGGIGLIVGGALLVSIKENSKGIFAFRKGFWYILLSCLLFGTTWVLSKYILSIISYWNLFFWSRIGGFLAFCLLLLAFPLFRRSALNFKSVTKKGLFLIANSEVIGTSATFLSLIALTKGPVSIISTISSSQPFFVLLYIVILTSFFKKSFNFKVEKSALSIKITASFFIAVGFLLITNVLK